jgi:hypothetical protein
VCVFCTTKASAASAAAFLRSREQASEQTTPR